MSDDELRVSRDRVATLLATLEGIAAGEADRQLPISPLHDELDALAFCVNVLADELRWAHVRMMEAERAQAARLRDELAHLARVATLDALAGTIAHEINQPLTAIITNAEAGLQTLSGQDASLGVIPVLADIARDGRRASDVIARVRALLHKDSSRSELLPLNRVVEDVVRLVEQDAARRRIVLDVVLEPGAGLVAGDRVQIQQVVLNLLLNAFDAVEHRDDRYRRVTLRTGVAGGNVVLAVRDEGVDVAENVLEQMFEPFYTTKPNGIGLGLSICRTLIDAHGGTLQAARNQDTGITVTVSIPAHQEQP